MSEFEILFNVIQLLGYQAIKLLSCQAATLLSDYAIRILSYQVVIWELSSANFTTFF